MYILILRYSHRLRVVTERIKVQAAEIMFRHMVAGSILHDRVRIWTIQDTLGVNVQLFQFERSSCNGHHSRMSSVRLPLELYQLNPLDPLKRIYLTVDSGTFRDSLGGTGICDSGNLGCTFFLACCHRKPHQEVGGEIN